MKDDHFHVYITVSEQRDIRDLWILEKLDSVYPSTLALYGGWPEQGVLGPPPPPDDTE